MSDLYLELEQKLIHGEIDTDEFKREFDRRYEGGRIVETLKPCPFCGEQPRLRKKSGDIKTEDERIKLEIYWWLECNCGIRMPIKISHYEVNNKAELVEDTKLACKDGRKEVIRMWNTRAQADL